MLYDAAKKSKGRPQYVQEKMLSTVGHIANVHHFPRNKIFKECEHAMPVPPRPYLPENSPELEGLRDILCGKNNSRYQALGRLDENQHTGLVETANALHNYYAPKANHLTHLVYDIKAKLTVIDFNKNSCRPTVKDSDGCEKVKIFRNTHEVEWRGRKVFERRDDSWKNDLIATTLRKMRDGGDLKEPNLLNHLKVNVRPCNKPTEEEFKLTSRFSKSRNNYESEVDEDDDILETISSAEEFDEDHESHVASSDESEEEEVVEKKKCFFTFSSDDDFEEDV